ncbi:Cation/Ca2+ exchanger [Emiliania huxleyi CCMP1516]|uniref:Sodium/calcium exchanger membrane region domain-containing protein n=2 Tax=Emiliania huxleyi TaxID=2903 RepID=A0A0D3KR54_EMIH1|nr:Cation/Ca2+ exchanger [Emiliania huxleyi CCMP1516]EOD38239.1 Cation/Ca2+ exchanger [Emiliania huxleyi CCMP1516]|eukprot:XP_005790668.1 Cation/Ca2+ exchanger [Emiliania huxleyi CCMP1516]
MHAHPAGDKAKAGPKNQFALHEANCTEVGNAYFGSYVEHWHCTFGESPMALLPLGVWLAMLIAALCSTADTFLIPQLSYISTYLRLKPDVAGVTLLAFGNGAPDVFTGIAVATAHPEEVDFSLLLADLVGGSIFIMTVVVGAVVWVAASHSPGWRLSRMPFYRDTISFFVAITLVLAVASNGVVRPWEGVFFLLNYLFYVALVIAIRYYIQPCWPEDTFGVYLRGKAQPVLQRAEPALRAISRRATPLARGAAERAKPIARQVEMVPEQAPPRLDGSEAPERGTPHVAPESGTAPLVASGASALGLEWDAGASRLSKALWLLEWPLSVLRWATIPTDSEWDARRRWTAATPPLTRDDVPPAWQPALVVTGFCFSIVWLDLVATEVVALIETAGFLLGISTSILGLTVIAIGNSAGDLVSDIAAAKGGEAKMAVAACFGSPLLMNIIGAGASLTVRAIMTGGADTESSVSQVCRIAYLFLYTALFSHMVVFPLGGYSASRGYAVYLFALYAVFMLLALLAESRKLGDFLCPASSPCPPPVEG